jgi:inositol oxygenase
MASERSSENPLQSLDDWDDDVRRRYPATEPSTPDAPAAQSEKVFRDYGAAARRGVQEFYRINHARQTVDFVRQARERYLPPHTRAMGIWTAMDYLNELVDDSDPDTQLPQVAHAVQTAEAIRHDGHPDWFVLTGLIHDMGKVLCLFNEPQWAVTGDTFPVGCSYSPKIVYYEYFSENPDWRTPDYQTSCGIYEEGCGLDKVLMSWGHDEYLYHVVRPYVPLEAQYIIRYHSFYAGHRENEYQHLMNQQDRAMFRWVRKFNPYDLYTKSDEPPDLERLLPWYRELVAKYFPDTIWW